MKKILLALSILVSACASKDLPLKAEQLPSSSTQMKLDISAEVLKGLSDDYNIVLQFNFRNKDGRWLRVDQAELDLSNSDNQPYNIIIGKDLVTWAEAKNEEGRMDSYNNGMKTAGVAALGGAATVVGALTDNKALTAAGALTYTGAAVYSIYDRIIDTKELVQGTQKVPETHLYAPFTVPSMAMSKRWVLINAPTGRIGRTAQLTLKTVEGETLTYKINLVN